MASGEIRLYLCHCLCTKDPCFGNTFVKSHHRDMHVGAVQNPLAIALGEGRSLADSCRFANAVASFGLEGEGIAALASRETVERRLGGLG